MNWSSVHPERSSAWHTCRTAAAPAVTPIASLARAAAFVILLGVLASVPAQAQIIPKAMPDEIAGLELKNRLGRQLPLDLQFVDSSGRPTRLGDIFAGAAGDATLLAPPEDGLPAGKRPVLLMMMYFRCPILCPKMHQEVVELAGRIDFRIGREYDIVFVSFDPLDTPRDAERFKTEALILFPGHVDEYTRAGWHYLSGPASSSRTLSEAIGFPYRLIPESGEYSHGPALFLVTPDGILSRVFPNFEFSEPERASDVRLALVEASEGRIGSAFDRFMLFCYHFDPRAGSYVLQAMRVMQIGGALTVLVLGVLLAVLFRGEVHCRAAAAVAAAPSTSAAVPQPSPPGGVPFETIPVTTRARGAQAGSA